MSTNDNPSPAPVHRLVGRMYFYTNAAVFLIVQYLIAHFMSVVNLNGALFFFPSGFVLGMFVLGRTKVNPPNAGDHRAA